MFYLSLITFLCHTKELSLHQSVSRYIFIYIDNVFCVSSVTLVTQSSIDNSNLFAHAQAIGCTLKMNELIPKFGFNGCNLLMLECQFQCYIIYALNYVSIWLNYIMAPVYRIKATRTQPKYECGVY